MRCHEARRWCGPYLDSELDGGTTAELEQHLESCADCRRVFEAEEAVDKNITRALRSGSRGEGLWSKIESTLGRQPPRNLKRSKFTKSAVLTLASIVVAMLVFVVWTRDPKLDLAIALAADHAEYLAGGFKSQFDTKPPAELLDQANGRLDADAFDKLPVVPEFHTQGRRLCHLSGVPVAWTLARVGELPVSVIVLRHDEMNQFPQVRERLKAGNAVACGRAGRFHFAARVVGDYVVCAVAETSRGWVEDLVKTVPDSG